MKLVALMSGVLLAIVACGGEAAGDRAATVAGLTGDKTAGATAFSAKCATCHGADGGSGTSGPAIKGEDLNEIIEVMLAGKGTMPKFDTLSDQEISNIAAFAESL
jgi:cytochrome c-type biogenesis protein CcmH